ncbi:uncharacterized protein LOC5510794 [Nematostella vectensis]|uniref:uncharacterized protein LOC5510794 n=1 Tax=Nematostella vectensis TaxID=45351 RepID=UPI002077847B|nr:uncharacterized protein LOC5510794 [Nematostella vectensis]
MFSLMLVTIVVIFGSQQHAMAEDSSVPSRSKRSVGVSEVFALDHFIEVVEKIEQKLPQKSLKDIANSIRKLGYDDKLWQTLIGTAESLPSDALSESEKQFLEKAVMHGVTDKYENGVVLKSAGEAIAIGHVINGICAGLDRKTSVSLKDWEPTASDTVDNLYAATIARDLGISILFKKNGGSTSYFGPGGSWEPSEECPNKFRKPAAAEFTKATNAQLLGDMDGFILGSKVAEWSSKGVRLGQLLRMYYSTGACYDTTFASCNRYDKFSKLVNQDVLLTQVIRFANAEYLKNNGSYPGVKVDDIRVEADAMISGLSRYLENIHGEQVCKTIGCELPSNLVFLMDESGSISAANYNIQKDFVKKIIGAFNISPRQTRVSVVEFSSEPRLSISIDEYNSKTRLKCAVGSLLFESGVTHTGKALKFVQDNVFEPIQNSSESKGNAMNILVLLTDGKSNDPDANLLANSVRNIKRTIKDLTIISVGVADYDLKELEFIATDPSKHVFTSNNFDNLLGLVNQLQNRTCSTAFELELDFTITEVNAVITAYVSPGSVRYFMLPAKRFAGVMNINVKVRLHHQHYCITQSHA